eukprot:m.166470 g.166470  ORF g.166470 m.166470 type:complete len:62 (+) comp38915_c1_seq2:1941-2126(+)
MFPIETPVDESSNLIVLAYVGAPLLVSAIVVIVIGAVLYQRWKQVEEDVSPPSQENDNGAN